MVFNLVKNMKTHEALIGRWVSSCPGYPGDYLVEYVINKKGGRFQVNARDLKDGEEMRISDVRLTAETLEFVSFMPSTKRRGLKRLRLRNKNYIDTEFTFTTVEELKRVSRDGNNVTEDGEALIGHWSSSSAEDSDDYLVEYLISKARDAFKVRAKDLQDGEEMKISDLSWDGRVLEFISFMPSTRRKGLNKFRVKDSNHLWAEFTFTIVEELERRQ